MKKSILKISFLLVIIAALGFIISCSEEFYENELRGAEVADNFYRTDDEALQGVLAAYMTLGSSYAFIWETPWTYRSLMGDEMAAGGLARGSIAQYEIINEYNFDANNDHSSKIFSNMYNGINRTNVVLDNMVVDTPGKAIVSGEAKFLRAANYFDLVTLFGEKIPLVTKILSTEEFQQSPAEVGAIWSQIEKDLTEAIAALPLKSAFVPAMKFRANKGAAQALLGKAYLYQQKYDLAATQFEAVINSGQFNLISDYSRLWRKEQEFGAESLFELSYTDAKGNNLGGYNWGESKFNTDNVLMLQFAPRIENFDNMGTIGQEPGFGAGYPLSTIFDAATEAGDDIRRKAVMTEEEFLGDGVTFKVPRENIYGYFGLIRTKLAQFLDEAQGPIITLNNGTNWRYLRYADVLLMAAEAQVLKNGPDFSKAQGYINQVRSRVELDDITTAGPELMEVIIKERQLELSFEGARFPDLIRWNAAGIISESELTNILGSVTGELTERKAFEDKHKLLPIPQLELNTNPNIEQNHPDW
ncbi:RagB/SusD family nutrient uptake outer membrane protein [Aquimarina agarivorans]|uniref:RagB/SusD family nutrient uptake outer membrane protein n=1 Tax=Aquimarina agarivorans TaxID=980584 RepID=UPI000248FC74|nr:RagB/SusD family nutrient uptake outer membrane protein [Aquimarina agarivorans]